MPILSASCPVCGSSRTDLWKSRNLNREPTPEDVKITDGRYGVTLTLYKCADCSFIFAASSETGELTALCEQMADPSYEEGAESRTFQMRWLLRLGMSARPQARNLPEIGAGNGLLIAEANRLGLEAVGLEPSLLINGSKQSGVTRPA